MENLVNVVRELLIENNKANNLTGFVLSADAVEKAHFYYNNDKLEKARSVVINRVLYVLLESDRDFYTVDEVLSYANGIIDRMKVVEGLRLSREKILSDLEYLLISKIEEAK